MTMEDRAVSLNAVIDILEHKSNANPSYWYTCDVIDRQDTIDDVMELPPVTPQRPNGQRPNGHWERMSEFPIEDDDRFKCSHCGNVVHYKDRINLYTFNRFCGRCGSYNGGDDNESGD